MIFSVKWMTLAKLAITNVALLGVETISDDIFENQRCVDSARYSIIFQIKIKD